MKKQDYLSEPNVISFINWLVSHVARPQDIQISNRFTIAKTKQNFHFKALEDALLQYQWGFQGIEGIFNKGHTYSENEMALLCLENELKNTIEKQDPDVVKRACIRIFTWGGVTNGNKKWAEDNPEEVLKEILTVKGLLENHADTFNKSAFSFRFNAGMTKVYSLLLPNFIIYDSRVAGTLAWLVTCWSKLEKGDGIPEELKFACMNPKESANVAHKKIRNPDQLIFPYLNNRALPHATWNVRASWLLESVVEKIRHFENAFSHQKNPMRALEAAMFMWGYDLSGSKFQSQKETTTFI